MQQNKQQKKKKVKPQLIIDTNDYDNNQQIKIESNNSHNENDRTIFKRKQSRNRLGGRNQVELKCPMSAKNHHQSKNAFVFPGTYPKSLNQQQQMKLKTLQRLEIQKQDLMKSLQILKQGAVSAIIEKQQEITKLRSQIYQHTPEQKLQLYEKQLHLRDLYKKQLQQQLQQMRDQMRKQRVRFETQLYQKQEIIQNLYKQLNQSYGRIDNLQKCDQLLTQKIKIVQWQNFNLSQQLQMSISRYNQSLNLSQISNIQHSNNNRHRFSNNSQNGMNFSMSDSNFLNLNLDQHSNHFASDNNLSQKQDLSIITVQKRYVSSQLGHNDDEERHSSTQSFYSQRIQLMQYKHQEQIQRIKQQYQAKIARMRKVYEKSHELKRNTSKQSLNSMNSMSGSNQKSRKNSISRTSSQKSLSKNNSLQILNFNQNMYAIDEKAQHDQAGTPRYFNLKDQILQTKYNDNATITNTKSFGFNDDTMSQFTSQHFQYPFSYQEKIGVKLFQRTNSIGNFQGEKQDHIRQRNQNNISNDQNIQKSSEKSSKSSGIDFYNQKQKFINLSKKYKKQQKQQKVVQNTSPSNKNFKKGIMLFCMGLVTGGTLFGIGNKLLKST